jgi:predicted DNA-binding transcriptional regulator AlpA
MLSDWMTNEECARHRNCAESTLNKERVRGDGPPYVKIRGRMVRYSRQAVDQWLAAQTRRSTSEGAAK